MHKLTAAFRIVTPMFIAGADQNKAEIRAPSIKGALRFWYRAIYPQTDSREEFRIFGGTEKGMGQSRFHLRLTQRNMHLNEGEIGDQRWNNSKISYLGYGVIDRESTGKTRIVNGQQKDIKRHMTRRPYLKEGSRFSLEILFKPREKGETDEEHDAMRRKVQRSLWALVMLGGLGARSRKGFGSLAVQEIEGMDDDLPTLMPRNRDELLDALRTFFEPLDVGSAGWKSCPELTCFSALSRCVVTQPQDNAMETLEWLGETIHKYRSHRGDSSLPWANKDHDLMQDWIENGIEPDSPPKRAAFGLPHNYFFTSLGNKKGEINLMEGDKKGRRAAPLLFRIHALPSSTNRKPQACVVASYMPARLIPEGRELRFSSDNYDKTCELPLPDDFSAVTDLLNRIAADGGNVEVWSHV